MSGWYAFAIVAAIFATGDYVVYCWMRFGSSTFGFPQGRRIFIGAEAVVWQLVSILALLIGAGAI